MDTMNLAPAANITLLTFSDTSVVRFKACMQSVYNTLLWHRKNRAMQMQGFEKTAQKPLSSKLVPKQNDILVTVKDNDRKIMGCHDKHGPVVHRPLHCFQEKILLVVASCFEHCLDISVQDDVGLHAQCTAARYLSAHIWYCIVAASSHSASRFANYSAFYFVTLLAVHDLHIVHAQLFVKYVTMVGVGVAIFHPQVHAQLVAVKN